jgi:uncharacterized protein (TIGR02246 family)
VKAPCRASAALLALAWCASAAAQAPNDESKVRALASRWEQAWNAHDMNALARLFSEDADFVNVGARHWQGRAEIESQHAARAGQFVDSIWSTGQTRVQFLTPDIALAHVTWAMKGDRNPDGTSREPREGVFTWLVVKKDSEWLIRAAQNTNRGNLPSPPGVGGPQQPGSGLPIGAPSQECSFGVKFQGIPFAPMTLRFHEIPIRKLFDVIEKASGTPFRVPAELDYRVTFDLRNVPPCRVLEIIAESQSLEYRQDGATIVVVAPQPPQ